MIVKFSDDLKIQTGYRDTVEVDAPTVGAAIQSVFNKYPNLLVFLLQDKCKEAKKTSIKLNGEYIFETESAWIEVGPEDVLEFSQDIPEGESATARVVLGAVLLAISWAYPITAPYLAPTGLSLVLGGVGELIAGKPSLPSLSGNGDESNTYTFAGIRNSTVSGTPISIVYGRHRVGGHVLDAYVDSIGKDSYLYALLGVSEGEIAEIDPNSIEINDRAAGNFPDVGAYWRSGTDDQNRTSYNSVLKDPAFGYNAGSEGVGDTNTTFTITNSAPLSAIEISGRFHVPSTPYYTSGAFVLHVPTRVSLVIEVRSAGVLIGTYKQDTLSGTIANQLIQFKDANNNAILVGGNLELSFFRAFPNGINLPLEVTLTHYWLLNQKLVSDITDSETYIYGFGRLENSVSHGEAIPHVKCYSQATQPVLTGDPNTHINEYWFNTSTKLWKKFNGTTWVSTDGAGLVVSTSADVDTTKVIVSAAALYKRGAADLQNTRVDFRVFCRPTGTSTWTEATSGTNLFFIEDKTKSEVVKSFIINFNIAPFATGINQYDIAIFKTTDDHTGSLDYQDEVRLKELNEIIHEKLIYPCTALLGIRVKATEQLSGGMPNITSIVAGVKVKVPANYYSNYATGTVQRYTDGTWDGTLSSTKIWTDNPVWCLYDILTNERYGLAKYFRIKESKRGLMLANFYLMAQYCDTYLKPDGTESTWDDPTARPRFSLNLVLDSSKNAIEWINIICAAMRASWYYSEGLFWLDIDRPKPITQIFNMSSISDFTQTGNSYKNVPNVYEVQFVNKDKDYAIDSFVVESPSIQGDATIEERKKNLNFVGVTDFDQAASLAAYALNTGERSNSVVTFKTGTRGLLCGIGDVIGVQHDVPQWGFGGHVVAYNATTKELTLNYTMRFELDDDDSPHQYSIKISHKGGKPVTYGIVEQEIEEGCAYKETDKVILSSDSDGGTSFPALTFTPERGDMYTIGVTTFETKPFKVAGIKRDTEEKIEITCTEYDEAIYTAADKVDTLGAIVGDIYSSLPDPSYTSVKNFKAEQTIYTDSAGIIKTGVQMYYSIPSNVSWKAVSVKYDIDGSGVWVQLDDNTTGSILLPEVTVNGTYRFVACSVYKNGTKQLVEEALADTLNSPYAEVVVNMELPNTVFMQGVTGLQVQNKGNDPTFEGKDCVVTWNKPVSIDSISNGVTEPDENGANTLTGVSWLKEYRITVLNLDGSTRRTDKTIEEVYVYSHEQNHQDGTPVRSFTVRVVSVDRLGRVSDPAELTVSNPAPQVLV